METVIPIARIQAEAAAAAQHHSDVQAASPYPLYTDAGHQFKAYFLMARQQLQATEQPQEVNP